MSSDPGWPLVPAASSVLLLGALPDSGWRGLPGAVVGPPPALCSMPLSLILCMEPKWSRLLRTEEEPLQNKNKN